MPGVKGGLRPLQETSNLVQSLAPHVGVAGECMRQSAYRKEELRCFLGGRGQASPRIEIVLGILVHLCDGGQLCLRVIPWWA